MTSIAVSSKNIPIIMYDNCIMTSTCQGLKSHFVINKDSMALTAPIPSKTAPKQSAARITHINIHDMPSVFLNVSSMTFFVRERLASAAIVAAVAPTAELSTRLVIPIRNKPVIKKKIRNGTMPAFNSLSFSLSGISSSSLLTVGARWG